MVTFDRLCGLVVRVPGYRYGGPGYNSRRNQTGPHILVRIIKELLE
jgi:hypothetical protein